MKIVFLIFFAVDGGSSPHWLSKSSWVIDQFEEVFTLCGDDVSGTRFSLTWSMRSSFFRRASVWCGHD